MIKIDKDIPIPTIRGKYPFKDMKVGDSFLVEKPTVSKHNVASALHSSAKKMGKDYKITVRREENGVRCWRTQ